MPLIDIEIELTFGTKIIHTKAVYDTGSNRSYINEAFIESHNLQHEMIEKERTLVGADGEFKITHEIEANARLLNGTNINCKFGILNTADVDVIIGCDIQSELGPVIVDVKSGSVSDKSGLVLFAKETVTQPRTKSKTVEIPPSVFEHSQINEEQKRMITQLLQEFTDIMVTPETPAVCAAVQATIPSIEGSMPFCSVKPYPIPPHYRERAQKEIDKWRDQGLIGPTQSSYNAPVLCVEKKLKPGQEIPDLRVCIDYRKLNQTIAPDPCIEESLQDILREIEDHQFRSVFDMPQAYLQIPLKEEDRHKTAFLFLGKQYQFNVAPFGLSISGSAFVRQMKKVTSPLDRRQVKSYVDDVLITSRTFEEHLECIRQFMESVRKNKMMLSFEKMQLCQKQVLFLGYELSEEGFKINPKKLNGLNEMGDPESKADVRRLLGFVGFWRNFVPALSEITKGLTDSLSAKNWVLTDEMKKEFEEIKRVMNSEPVCAYPRLCDPECPFILYCDASHHTAAYTLCQKRDGQLKMIANGAMKFDPSKVHLCIFEKELWAVKWALKREKYLLKGSKFILKIDSQAVANVIQPKGKEIREYPNDKVARWVMSIFNFQFELEKIKTEENILADALSRLPRKSDEAKDTGEFLMPAEIPRESEKTQNDHLLITKEPINKQANKTKSIHRQHHNWEKLFKFVHDQHGHQGFDRSLKMLRKLVDDIPGDRDLLRHYIRSCEYCLFNEPYTGNGIHGNISDYKRPTRPMQNVQVDIHVVSPKSISGYKYILGIVDEYSWFGRFYPLKTKTAKETAARIEEFLRREGGAVETIKSDWGTEFLGMFEEKLREYNVNIEKSTPYHKNKNVFVERAFRHIKGLLKASENPQRWVTNLAQANVLYNALPQVKTGISPYQTLYGFPCRRGKLMVEALSREQINAIVNEKWEDLARESHIEPKRFYEVNSKVLIRRPPKGSHGLCEKYGQRYQGPFQVLRRINATTYVIKMLGKEIKVHLSQMKPYLKRDLGIIRGGEEDGPIQEAENPEIASSEEIDIPKEISVDIGNSNTGEEQEEGEEDRNEDDSCDDAEHDDFISQEETEEDEAVFESPNKTKDELKAELETRDLENRDHTQQVIADEKMDTLGKIPEINLSTEKFEETKREPVTLEESEDTEEILKEWNKSREIVRKLQEEDTFSFINDKDETANNGKTLSNTQLPAPVTSSSTPAHPRLRSVKQNQVHLSPIVRTIDERGVEGTTTHNELHQQGILRRQSNRRRQSPERLQINSKAKTYAQKK